MLAGRCQGRLASARVQRLVRRSTCAVCHPHCAALVNASSPPPTASVTLEEWLVQQGGLVCGVELRDADPAPHAAAHRTLLATRDHEPGACLIAVPRACQLRYDAVEQQPGLLRLFEHVPTGSATGGAAWQFKQALTVSRLINKQSCMLCAVVFSRCQVAPLMHHCRHLHHKRSHSCCHIRRGAPKAPFGLIYNACQEDQPHLARQCLPSACFCHGNWSSKKRSMHRWLRTS
jgi:hypothetical protein